jgi:nicotinate dehydrogenase subunit B
MSKPISNRRAIDESIELERYELFADPSYQFNFELERRDFFKLLGGGLVLVFTLDALAQESGRQGGESGRRQMNASIPKEIGGWLQIAEDGSINVFTGKVEFGQNIRTSLAQAVAEELRVPMTSIRLTMGDTDLTPFDMGTFGSRTTPTMAPQLRKAAAAAREVLIDLAAVELKADRASLSVKDGFVFDSRSKKSVSFGTLNKGQKLLKVIPDNVSLTPASEWTIAGKSAAKVNGRDAVTGKHRYTSDLKLPAMLFGKVVRPPSFNARLVGFDSRDAELIPRVKVLRDGNFLGVAASDQQTATQAASAIKAEWKTEEQPSAKDLFDYLRKQASESQPGTVRGSIAEGLAKADKKIEQTYTGTARTARRRRALGAGQAHRVDWNSTALRRSKRTRRSVSNSRRSRPRDRARHRSRLRR